MNERSVAGRLAGGDPPTRAARSARRHRRRPAASPSSSGAAPARSARAARRRRPARCAATSTSPTRPADRGADRDLHLHRLDHGESVADLDDVARLHVDADDERGRRCADDSGVVAGEAVGDAVDLDEVLAAVDRRHARVDAGRRW